MSEAMAMVRLLMTELPGSVRISLNSSPLRCVRPAHTCSGLRNIPWYRAPMVTVSTSLLAALLATATVAPPTTEADFVSLFNGTDLQGWIGDTTGYSVELPSPPSLTIIEVPPKQTSNLKSSARELPSELPLHE